jgi:hypothetical protein
LSRTSTSSLRTAGGRRIEPNSPAFMRACWPTITFSTAVIEENRRMFWNVRATPSEVMMSGRVPVTSEPPNVIRPSVGL